MRRGGRVILRAFGFGTPEHSTPQQQNATKASDQAIRFRAPHPEHPHRSVIWEQHSGNPLEYIIYDAEPTVSPTTHALAEQAEPAPNQPTLFDLQPTTDGTAPPPELAELPCSAPDTSPPPESTALPEYPQLLV